MKRAGEYLNKCGKRQTTQAFQIILESRTAVDAILHASRQADLVVLGTHGRRGPTRWWLGSVAERVLRETQLPLLVVHAGDDATSPQQLFAGTVTEVTGDDAPAARASVNATWAAIPVPEPRTAAWRSHVGEPLLQKCAIPVLFVPEADGGPSR